METEPTPEQTQRASVHERRMKRQQGKPNKSQVQASKARVAQSAPTVASGSGDTSDAIAVVAPAGAAPAAAQKRLTPAQRRAIERGTVVRGTGMAAGVFVLTREQEMQMVREDMRRLLVIAGVLLVAMLALLFVID